MVKLYKYFFKKTSISLLDSEWLLLGTLPNMGILPRADELIYYNNIYYRVTNVVHNINDKHGIFILVNPLGDKKPK